MVSHLRTSLLAVTLPVLMIACGGAGSGADAGAYPVHPPDGSTPSSDGGPQQPDAGELPDGGPLTAPTPWTLTSRQLVGDGGTELRQGTGAFALELEGTGLSQVTSYSSAGLTLTVVSATDTKVVLSGVIPHGFTKGSYGLTLSNADATGTIADALSVSPISVAASTAASDTQGWGTPTHPFRSLTHAMTFAQAGDEIHLSEGTYDDAHGEQWPGVETSAASPSLPANVRAGVLLSGAGETTLLASTSLDGGSHTGLIFGSDAGVQQLRFSNFHRAVVVRGGKLSVSSVSCSGGASDCFLVSDAGTLTADLVTVEGSRGSGVATFGGTLNLSHLTATANRTGVYVNGGKLNLSNSDVSGNGVGTVLQAGLVLFGGGVGTVTSSNFDDNWGVGIELATATLTFNGGSVSGTRDPQGGFSMGGVEIFYNPQVTLRNVTLQNNAQQAIQGYPVDAASISLFDDTFSQNNGEDIDLSADSSTFMLSARGVKTHGASVSIAVTGPYALDLGTANDGGYNTLSATDHVLELHAWSGSSTASSSHTSFNGAVPAAATVTGPVTSARWDLLSSSDHLHLY